MTDVALFALPRSAFSVSVAETIAVPDPTAVTTPDGETFATEESDVVQPKVPVNGRPASSLAVAASWIVAAGDSVTLSTESVTVGEVGGGGARILSPPHERISQPSVMDPTERRVVFRRPLLIVGYASGAATPQHIAAFVPRSQTSVP
jgi:hypothetical protein